MTLLPPFRWTGARELAARLVAEDMLTDEQIAARAGIKKRQLERWKKHPTFMARAQSILDQIRAAVLAEGIANKQNRVDALNDRWRRMQKVIDEREKQHENIDTLQASPAAGASTGLMVLTVRYLPGGARVEEWAVDVGLLKELRDHEKQAAQELEQWTERKQVTGKDGKPLEVKVIDDSPDRAAAILAVLAEAGVLPPGTGGVDQAAPDAVHPAQPDD